MQLKVTIIESDLPTMLVVGDVHTLDPTLMNEEQWELHAYRLLVGLHSPLGSYIDLTMPVPCSAPGATATARCEVVEV